MQESNPNCEPRLSVSNATAGEETNFSGVFKISGKDISVGMWLVVDFAERADEQSFQHLEKQR